MVEMSHLFRGYRQSDILALSAHVLSELHQEASETTAYGWEKQLNLRQLPQLQRNVFGVKRRKRREPAEE